MKQTIKIEDVKPKVSKNGKAYISVNGKHSVFEKDLIRTFEDNIGKTFEVEIVENNGFSNIRQVYQEINALPSVEVVKVGNTLNQVVSEEIKGDEVKVIKEKPNSRTFGKGDDQVKIYFDTAQDLNEQVKALESLMLMPKSWLKEPLTQ